MTKRSQITDINIYRNQRRVHKNVRWVLIPVFLVVCLFAGYFFSMSAFFSVSHIEIIGNEKASEEEILAVAGVEKGMNIFAVNRKAAGDLLTILPRIQRAEVERTLPGTVRITVQERKPVAIMSLGTAMLELDHSGRILDRFHTLEGFSLPLITGVDLEGQGLVPGTPLHGQQLKKALEILDSLPADAENIGEINVTNPEDILLYTTSGMEIRLGDSHNFEEKYLLYSNIILENRKNAERAIRYIDVSIVEKPAFAYL